MRAVRVAIYMFLGLGPVLLALAALWWSHYHTWLEHTVVTKGTIVSTEVHWSQPTRQGEMREQQQAANVAWSDLDGGQHVLVVYARTANHFSQGDSITVRYSPSDPTDGEQDQASVPLGPAILGLMGLGFVGLAFKVLVIDKGAALPRAR